MKLIVKVKEDGRKKVKDTSPSIKVPKINSQKICIKCGKLIPFKERRRNFCSDTCRTRYNSLKQYNKLKGTRKYKQYRKEYFNKWRKKNKAKFNAMMQKPSREYQKRKTLRERLERESKKNVKKGGKK